ncbi:MAG: hypothetical protein BWY27_00019 [Bacteroidetes bacterium ADurb.Bin234]|nr:MAG: hypothetical protein BWY27_00019 [Bacteroidetes bacterium ADurb.Bin234]
MVDLAEIPFVVSEKEACGCPELSTSTCKTVFSISTFPSFDKVTETLTGRKPVSHGFSTG